MDSKDPDVLRLRFRENIPAITTTTDAGETVTTSHPRRVIVDRPRTDAGAAVASVYFNDDDPLGRILMPAVAEFIGTLIYVLATNLLGTAGSSSTTKVGIALFDGAVFTSLILMLYPYGGGHFNPALTLGSMMTLNTKWILGLCIIFCQMFGAFFGALLSRAALSSSTFVDMFSSLSVIQIVVDYSQPTAGVGSSEFSQFSNRFQVYLLDSLLGAFVVLALLLSMDDGSASDVAIAVGTSKAATAYIAMQSLGQAGNLARLVANNAIASIFMMDFNVWRLFYLYFFSTITAPIIAAILYWILRTVRLPRLDMTRPVMEDPIITTS